MKKNRIIALTITLGLGFLLTTSSNTRVVHSTYNTNTTTLSNPRVIGQTLSDIISDENLAKYLANSITQLENVPEANRVNEPLTQPMIDGLRTVNINGNIINDLTGLDTFVNIETFSIYGNITTLPDIFNNFNNLKTITVSDSNITSLPESLTNLSSLNSLVLNNTEITSLPDSIDNLQNLKTLTIDNSNLSTLPLSFTNLQSLTSLSITKSKLTSLPSNIGQFQNLETLSLTSNQLTSIPNSIGDLSAIRNLGFNHNNIVLIPDSITNLTTLTSLNLSNNKLEALPEGFGDLINLNNLYLNHNNLSYLPTTFSNLSNLTNVYLDSNKLTSLPLDINNLTNLRQLHATNNSLTSLPDNIVDLPVLTNLNLSSNKISTLPNNFSNLTTLEVIELQNNLLTSIPEDFGSFRNLSYFNFSDNLITNLPDSIINLKDNNTINPLSFSLEQNLLPKNVYLTLSENGLNNASGNNNVLAMKQLDIKKDLAPISITSILDLTNLNLNNLVNIVHTSEIYEKTGNPLEPYVLVDTVISYNDVLSNQSLELVDLVDETGNSVSINDYIQDNKVIKSARLFAKVSIKQTSGILTNDNPNTTTIDQISFTLTKSPDLVVEPETVTPSVNKQDPIINGLGLDANAIEANNDNITNNTLVLPTTGNDTNIVVLSSIIIASLGYILNKKIFN